MRHAAPEHPGAVPQRCARRLRPRPCALHRWPSYRCLGQTPSLRPRTLPRSRITVWSWGSRLPARWCELRRVRDVRLDLELRVEKLLVLLRLQLPRARGWEEREVDRRDDAWQRSNVVEERGDLMVRPRDAELVAIGVELGAVDDAVGLHVGELETRAARCTGD